jgi:hypothetical protein
VLHECCCDVNSESVAIRFLDDFERPEPATARVFALAIEYSHAVHTRLDDQRLPFSLGHRALGLPAAL